MSKKSEIYGRLAEAFTELQGLEETAEAKSDDSAADGVAVGNAGSKGSKVAAPAAVAAKTTAKPGKGKPAAAPAAPAITFEVLKAKLTELVNTKGKEAVKEILSGFGAPKLVELDEDNYAEAHAQAVAAMAEDDASPEGDDDDMFGS